VKFRDHSPVCCDLGPHAGQWRYAGYLYLTDAERSALGDEPWA